MAEEQTRLIVGCMTGTSLDGLDAALVRIAGTGLTMRAELLGHHAAPLSDALRSTLVSLASGAAHQPIVYMQAARDLGGLYAEGVEHLLSSGLIPPSATFDFVVAHGQTIWHEPKHETGPKSWQLFDPWPIVRRLNMPVCYDLRQADLIAGGEGAPLTPIADWVMYRNDADVVANLGGVLNLTLLDADPTKITGKDVYPCNLLLDGLCMRLFDQRFDADGGHAARGAVTPVCVHAISDAVDAVCACQGSLGREQFSPQWFDALMKSIGNDCKPEDILNSAARLIAFQLGGTFPDKNNPPMRLVLAGGGVKHQTLVKLVVEQSFFEPVVVSEALGIPSEAREAMGFAVLGALSQDGVPVSLPQVTGATEPGVAGVWAYA